MKTQPGKRVKVILNQQDTYLRDLVLGKVIAGVSKRRIAEEMGVNVQTVRRYVADLKRDSEGTRGQLDGEICKIDRREGEKLK